MHVNQIVPSHASQTKELRRSSDCSTTYTPCDLKHAVWSLHQFLDTINKEHTPVPPLVGVDRSTGWMRASCTIHRIQSNSTRSWWNKDQELKTHNCCCNKKNLSWCRCCWNLEGSGVSAQRLCLWSYSFSEDGRSHVRAGTVHNNGKYDRSK